MTTMRLADIHDRLDDLLSPVAAADRPAISNQLLPLLLNLPETADQRLIEQDLLDRDKFYAIRDSDLQLLPDIITTVLSLYPDIKAGAIGSLAKLLLRYWRKRAEITCEHAAVLRTMTTDRTRRWSPEGLTTAIRLGLRPLTRSTMELLNELLAYPTKEGPVALVQQHPDGTWTVSDV